MAKLILSRKGFDSANGGKPSPIWNERLISFPIPQKGTNIHYSQLVFDGNRKMATVFKDLGIKKISTEAHLDPDINQELYPKRPKDWKAAFGQTGAALSHLQNEGVGPGDLFLFFGWFRRIAEKNGKLYYVPQSPDLHLIYGYLEIGEVIQLSKSNIPNWLKEHPHYVMKHTYSERLNTIYVAADRSTWFPNQAGAATFSFSEKSVLTLPGQSRTQWKLPACFFEKDQCLLSYHRHKKGIPLKGLNGKYYQIKAASRGQEFVIDASSEIRSWIQSLHQEL